MDRTPSGKLKQKSISGAPGNQKLLPPTLGELLKAAREAKGLSIRDLSRETRIRHGIIEALEAGDATALPEPVFVRGFLGNLARTLDLDADELLALYFKEQRRRGPAQYVRGNQHYLNNSLSISWGSIFTFIGGIIVVFLIWLVWTQLSAFIGQTTPLADTTATATIHANVVVPVATPTSVSIASPTTAPAAVIPQATPTPQAKPVQVQIKVVRPNTWARIIVDDKKVVEDVLENGKTYTWSAQNSIQIRTSNAAGIEVTFNGANQGVLGEAGQVVTANFTPTNRVITPD